MASAKRDGKGGWTVKAGGQVIKRVFARNEQEAIEMAKQTPEWVAAQKKVGGGEPHPETLLHYCLRMKEDGMFVRMVRRGEVFLSPSKEKAFHTPSKQILQTMQRGVGRETEIVEWGMFTDQPLPI